MRLSLPSSSRPPIRKLLPAAAALLLAALPSLAAGQSLDELVRSSRAEADSPEAAADSLVLPRSPARVIAAEVALGSLMGAAAGFGVGLLAESIFCDDCDAGSPGGDTAGLLVGVPLGAAAGVWLVGKGDPPAGRMLDAVLGGLVGAGVFAGWSALLEQQSDLIRWSGVVFAGGAATMAWNRSRPHVPAVPRAGEPRTQIFPVLDPTGAIGLSLRF